jgi:hypothetical protein
METVANYKIKSKRNLGHWDALLEEWILSIERFSRITDGDVPYWEPIKTSLCSFLEFPTVFFYLKEGVLSMSYMLFFATPSSRPPTYWGFRGALLV